MFLSDSAHTVNADRFLSVTEVKIRTFHNFNSVCLCVFPPIRVPTQKNPMSTPNPSRSAANEDLNTTR